MATNNKETAKSITALSELIKKQKAAARDAELTNDINELTAYIENTTEKIRENTIRKKISDNMTKRWNTATNPRTYFRAVLPKMFKTWHENMDLRDQMNEADSKHQKLLNAERQQAISNLKNELKTLIDSNKELSQIFKNYGESAAMEAALARQENKALKEAEVEFYDNMSKIEERLQTLDRDAHAEWAKRKGIQLVKIVEDDPTVEELKLIKAEISEQIENDARKYDEDRKQRVKDIKRQQREKESLLEEKRWWKKYFKRNTTDVKKPDSSTNFLDSLITGGLAGLLGAIIPFLLKAGLIAGIATAIKNYIDDPEFRNTVNKLVEKILQSIWGFMKEHWVAVIAALAIMFPISTIRLIAKGLKLLYRAVIAMAAKAWASLAIQGGGNLLKKPGWSSIIRNALKAVLGVASIEAIAAAMETDLESDEGISVLEREDFYKDLTKEEIQHHRDLIENENYTEAENYRNQLAANHGYRPATTFERLTSGSLSPKNYVPKGPKQDVESITNSVRNNDVPNTVPVEIANFGKESIGQIADIILAYRKLAPQTPPAVVAVPPAKNTTTRPLEPKKVSNASDTNAQMLQYGNILYSQRAAYAGLHHWQITVEPESNF